MTSPARAHICPSKLSSEDCQVFISILSGTDSERSPPLSGTEEKSVLLFLILPFVNEQDVTKGSETTQQPQIQGNE